ncbi:hypothetical protein [Rhizobium ruizarguesonis]|uniref:hypothetical protein n=1 Tax=Rhizobium ruizarguesonis TaxID=2081791 RepID=UPI001030BAC2|nr:hypothetical protein [Rhizobium ruizarguesonis]TAV04562.1 hypothetical protein ELI39_04275 [Rhizobium ruizarguesonis]
MKPDLIDRIRVMHRAYYHESIDNLPDGWWKLVMDFLNVVDGIGDLTDSVSVRFERCPDGLRAFVFPEMSHWHPEQMNVADRTTRAVRLEPADVRSLRKPGRDGRQPCPLHRACRWRS